MVSFTTAVVNVRVSSRSSRKEKLSMSGKIDWYDYWKIVEVNNRRRRQVRAIKRELRENARQLVLLFLFCLTLMLTVILVDRIL